MCILFVLNETNPKPDEYKLIVVSIRDEYYSRPALPLSHIDDIIGGRDLEKGREGGTWLAMNTNGRIAALLNILEPHSDISPDKKSRGFLVIDYLQSNYNPRQHLDQISEKAFDYNGFRMIAIHVKSDSIDMSVLSKFDRKPIQLKSGVYAFGNNRIEGKLWPKVENGRQKFEQIVNKYKKITEKKELVESLFDFLSDTTRYELDEQMSSQGNDKPIETLKSMNALNVMISGYGSRTRSVILVDNQLNVEFIEKTMKEPIDITNGCEWITNSINFKIKS
ncbi:transport and Golgi organization protein 2 homolog [Oppia nitens]|uniref:transport and Golgi organization protein 2 homolog n=1 Tax=Oppia nitens TaxID=1686743 RepID=UPI0023DB3A56|nr:transport and Golgi organization protein 2 homolog [Oppia nitens]